MSDLGQDRPLADAEARLNHVRKHTSVGDVRHVRKMYTSTNC